MIINIGKNKLTVVMADNSSAKALEGLLKNGNITIDMHDYGNFEKVGKLPKSLPRNDEEITTKPGDVILYQSNQLTIYYDTNTYNFTRIGHIENITQAELERILGMEDVTVRLSLN